MGGVNLMLSPEMHFNILTSMGFLSPDGRSYSFDARANGYGKGEGVGVVVLKRLADAVQSNDTIRAVIRASAVNSDGNTPGITLPSQIAQAENMRQAYRIAHLDMKDTPYFEAHGTGTAVGDPIEAEAIHAAFQRTPENPLFVGTLKANIGHLEAAAGMASLLKSIMVLENGILPPNVGFEKRNLAIQEDWNFRVSRL